MKQICLLLLLVGPARADELHQIYERHKEVTRELNHALKAVAREREAYAGATNPENQIMKWGSHFHHMSMLVAEQNSLWKRHDEAVAKLEVSAITDLIRRVDQEKETLPKRSLFFTQNQNDNALMGDLRERSQESFNQEFLAYNAASIQLQNRRLRERRRNLIARGLWGVALGTILTAILGRWRFQHRRTVILRSSAVLSGQSSIPSLIGGNIEVKGLIGRGGMGEVYEALDKTLERRIALKRLRGELLASRSDLEALLAEARVVASLRHENLVAIYSVERDAGQVYLAFEFVDGATLADLLAKHGRLGWAEAHRIFRSVCSALHYAHAQRIVHRDLKPANIMIARTGTVKVMDFGIAFRAKESISRLTRAAACGTPPYMAPEQELGGFAAGVDLFAISVCLYEMVTGELPFKGPNFLAQKREGCYLPASGLVADIPKGIDAFFKSALAPEPSKRFPTAAALAAAAALA